MLDALEIVLRSHGGHIGDAVSVLGISGRHQCQSAGEAQTKDSDLPAMSAFRQFLNTVTDQINRVRLNSVIGKRVHLRSENLDSGLRQCFCEVHEARLFHSELMETMHQHHGRRILHIVWNVELRSNLAVGSLELENLDLIGMGMQSSHPSLLVRHTREQRHSAKVLAR